jgi:5,10-methylenetetrahydrofolate reductase
MSNLSEALKSGKFVVTAEIGPPKGVDIEEMLEDAELLRGRVDAINVTDQRSSVMRLGSLATCRLLQERGRNSFRPRLCTSLKNSRGLCSR